MNKNFNIEIVAFAAERIAVFAERVFAIDNSVHRVFIIKVTAGTAGPLRSGRPAGPWGG